jgi:serine/threonine protein kinase
MKLKNFNQEIDFAGKVFNKKYMNGDIIDLSECYSEIKILSTLEEHSNIIKFIGIFFLLKKNKYLKKNKVFFKIYLKNIKKKIRYFLKYIFKKKKGVSNSEEEIIIIFEYYKWTLINYLKENELNFEEVLKIILEICNGISHLHSNNIMHRDLKCENIMISQEKIVKIIDFGLSTRFDVEREFGKKK